MSRRALVLVKVSENSTSFSQPESAGSLRRQIGQVLMKHHQSLERNNHALQPVSPASYGSSLEVYYRILSSISN